MTDTHASEAHAGPSFRAYILVFVALAICTGLSFGINLCERMELLGAHTGFALILLVSIVKAVLVGTFFMHLIVDWGNLYYLVFPAFILGSVLCVVLLPDIVLAWHHLGAFPVHQAAIP